MEVPKMYRDNIETHRSGELNAGLGKFKSEVTIFGGQKSGRNVYSRVMSSGFEMVYEFKKNVNSRSRSRPAGENDRLEMYLENFSTRIDRRNVNKCVYAIPVFRERLKKKNISNRCTLR